MLPLQCSTSVLNPNNPANYKPIKLYWDVEGKRGCWIPLGCQFCYGDLEAARLTRKLHKYKVMRVRASSTLGVDPGKWRRFRFK
jgi:hypothetical protein